MRISLFFLLTVISLSACAPSSMFTQEGLVTSSFGAAAGTGAGYLIGKQIGKKTENMLLGAATGSALGLMAGGLLHENNIRSAQQREVLIRQARMVGSTQKELDILREQLYDSTRWGGNEVKPWEERYWGDFHGHPYEGTLGQ